MSGKDKRTVNVPVSFLQDLVTVILMDLKFQPGLAVMPWVEKLQALIKEAK